MIYKPKGRKYYLIDFQWHGQRIQRRTKTTNQREANAIESAIRTELERGNYGILQPKPRATLAEFLSKEFLPYIEVQFKDTPNSAGYYRCGAASLLKSDLAQMRLDEITDQHASQLIAHRLDHGLKPTTINRDLKTLRRALSLASSWGKLDRVPKITLAKGERQRDRVLTADEVNRYLGACRHPDWRDCALLIVGTGLRPEDEACSLRWEHVELNGHNGKIRLKDAKTPAGRRTIPLRRDVFETLGIPDVVEMLRARHATQGYPVVGWLFPRPSRCGHLVEDTFKEWHAAALEGSGVEPFEPYVLRHSYLTWMAPHLDAFALARLAGHSSIRTTERYVHTQERTVEAGFDRLVRTQEVPTISPTKSLRLPVGSLAQSISGEKS